jgi:hypothetical protein
MKFVEVTMLPDASESRAATVVAANIALIKSIRILTSAAAPSRALGVMCLLGGIS